MLRLTGTLAENRQLRTVNLSMNSLTSQRNRDYIDILEEEDIEGIQNTFEQEKEKQDMILAMKAND